jgi:hypothetical protein
VQTTRCTVRDNVDIPHLVASEMHVGTGAFLNMNSSTASGLIGLTTAPGGYAHAHGSSLAGTRQAVSVAIGAEADLAAVSLDGSFHVDGGTLRLFGGTQTAGVDANVVTNRGHVDLEPLVGTGPATIVRDTQLERFGTAALFGASTGRLFCTSAADAWCDSATTVAGSTCDRCHR